MTVPDFPDEKAPDAHATAISLTGAPPLVFKRVIDFQVGTSIPANGTLTRPASGQFSLNQPGYEIQINVGTLSATAVIMSVELQWYDSVTTVLMDDEIYYFYSGDVNGHQIHGRGPSKGDQVVVVVKNYSGTSGVSFSYTLLQTSRTFTREFWKTITKGTTAPVIPGWTSAPANIAANVLTGGTITIAASGISNRLLPLYTGTVRIWGSTTDTVAGNSIWDIFDPADRVVTSPDTFIGSNGQNGFAPRGVGTLYAADIALPRGQCGLLLTNNSASSQTLATTITAQEDRS